MRGRLARHRHQAVHPGDLTRVGEAARARFRLASASPVTVEELAATERGFPPLETRITFWSGNDLRHQYRVFKPAHAVTAADLPPWWMKDALIVEDFPFCDCCG